MFSPSPRVADWGLSLPHAHDWSTFGVVLTTLALAGLVLAWRRRSARLLALLWLGAAALALGSDLQLGHHAWTPLPQWRDGVRLSSAMPFTWLVRIPGLASFREPSRFAELGLVPAALPAGLTVSWLRYHTVPVLVIVLALGILEAGQPGPAGTATMPAALPALDRPIAADHSGSIVLDVPFGIRGGVGIIGRPFAPEAEVLATADGHPLADGYLSRVPATTAAGIKSEPLYRDLMRAQAGHDRFPAAELTAAARNARRLNIGWVLLWAGRRRLCDFLVSTGFRLDYRADGVWVYRPASARPEPKRGSVPDRPPRQARPRARATG